ncbi:PaaI family thioesterase [Vibrio cholerae]|uniref:PaaI family thioesterase n=1 Tax=Gammaproteobacteria TaxID=1236 RepID=UPI001652398C|nr:MULTISPECIES: PaaI family thioesterase [Gammaproteobacteria]HDU8650530.1 PaaI family thioesterase [Morganella morganii subsp. morganii]MBF8950382.1 PaaI family thioesterase [Vibrio cholerae]MBF8957634.1 PaaI family thioesterase [Vibrio cholerae]MBF8961156.1 PaaI family thioesterase [Vibrio cholerae]MBF8968975.1 PaaI family thioesterase [Vibrio cholerae]
MNLLHEIGPHLTGLEQLKTMLEMDRRAGMGETLDIRLVEAEDGRVICEATPDVHVYNPLGTVHGGFTATMLDFACGYAVLSKMVPGQSFSTLEIKVAYHKAMTRETGLVRAEGKVVTFGRRLAYTESRLTDLEGRLYASATSSLIILSA